MASTYNEINPLVIQIAKFASEGLTDKQIGEKLGFSFRTVYRYRHGNNIVSGRYQKKRKRIISVRELRYKFLSLDELVLD